jgi:hypothetical protein
MPFEEPTSETKNETPVNWEDYTWDLSSIDTDAITEESVSRGEKMVKEERKYLDDESLGGIEMIADDELQEQKEKLKRKEKKVRIEREFLDIKKQSEETPINDDEELKERYEGWKKKRDDFENRPTDYR